MPFCDPFRQHFKRYHSSCLLDKFNYISDDIWFIGIGRISAWNDDNDPPLNTDNIYNDTDFFRNMYAMKKVTRDDVSYVIPRYDWVKSTIYTPYRDTVDLHDDLIPPQFYVLVDDTRVYKCIDNNDGGASTIAPVHTDPEIRKLADGYRWKFLYQISENDEKFLTKDWMPVEFVEALVENDDRTLQWAVQNAAVDGAIDFIDIADPGSTFAYAVPAGTSPTDNIVVALAATGATQVQLGGPNLVMANDIYNDYLLTLTTPEDVIQRRVITDSSPTAGNTILADFSQALTTSVPASTTTFTILPQVLVQGDGTGASAEGKVDATGGLSSIEMTNIGSSYTWADVAILPALPGGPGTSTNPASATAIMGPDGGHGSNPVEELGASHIMVAITLSVDESGVISTANDYRQVALVRNPLLASHKQQTRLWLDSGLSSDFTVGTTAGMTGNGGSSYAEGTVHEWNASNTTGQSELILVDVTGSFDPGLSAFNSSVERKISLLRQKTVAGTEGRLLKKLKLTPEGTTTFSPAGTDFEQGDLAIGFGLTTAAVAASYAVGEVYDWDLADGSNKVGFLSLEHPNDQWIIGEGVAQMDRLLTSTSRRIGKIASITETSSGQTAAYDATHTLIVGWDGANNLTTSSFLEDSGITVFNGSTTAGMGNILAWDLAATGGETGTMRVLMMEGSIGLSHTFQTHDTTPFTATVNSVVNQPELTYHSGEIVFIQNIKPISRDDEQKEEIKLVFGA